MVRRLAVTLVGAALLLLGLAMMVLPGPGILGIVAGLAVLASEYVWARRLLVRAKDKAEEAQRAAVASPVRTGASLVFALGMVVVGTLMVLVEDVAWPLLEGPLDTVWSPVTGTILVVTGLVLATTTVVTLRSARGTPSTWSPAAPGTGATRLERRERVDPA
ncbi:PGPGW domain-containing protein [Cellulomonas marina]|uniref:Putative transmembrane protein (PGPGW) n=1 Tax=Cellulomonas marina TaxID=988821 RepID=A0A1I1A525_9CELL|nr:PGPGW domain-containing protein [Cellulomonas marina]SFB33017.1 Putative transmembrane protein (PGPGW) [Cellulomonas marina]